MIAARDPSRPVRIANCSGFFGDRMSALAEIVKAGNIDFVTGDYLSEVTMLVLAKNRLKEPAAGYAASFLHQLKPVLIDVVEQGIRIVVNAGGLNPGGLANEIRAICESSGVAINVAHIEGDDLLDRLDEILQTGEDLRNLDTGQPLSSWGSKPMTANAYLGGWGIVAALEAGAQIVVCPRVTDASLVVGPAAWWHGWQIDDWDRLAGAVVAGHVIECGTQATGGNFSGFAAVPNFERLGFPIAEIDRDGASVITKPAGTGGLVSVATVTAQLLYEIQGIDYLNPDVTTHLDSITLEQIAPDRVKIAAVCGSAPPNTTKVAMTGLGGFENATIFVLTGLDIAEKALVVEKTLRARLASITGIEEIRFDLIGAVSADPASQLQATCLFKVAVRGSEVAVGRAFFNTLVEMALANYPGLFMTGSDARTAKSYGVYWPAIVRQDTLRHRVVHEDGSEWAAPLPPFAGVQSERAAEKPVPPRDWGACELRPLGRLFDARSGDKGGNANVGLWCVDDLAYQWLLETLTEKRFAELIPEAAQLKVERFPLANLRALNFVVRGLLDGGATETLRFDAQAKALGEYVLAKQMHIPVILK